MTRACRCALGTFVILMCVVFSKASAESGSDLVKRLEREVDGKFYFVDKTLHGVLGDTELSEFQFEVMESLDMPLNLDMRKAVYEPAWMEKYPSVERGAEEFWWSLIRSLNVSSVGETNLKSIASSWTPDGPFGEWSVRVPEGVDPRLLRVREFDGSRKLIDILRTVSHQQGWRIVVTHKGVALIQGENSVAPKSRPRRRCRRFRGKRR